MEKVTKEVAEQEVLAWLEKKKVLSVTIEANRENVEVLTGAVCEGVLELDQETWKWKHNLLVPLDGEKPTKDLTYQPRLNDKMVRPYLQSVKPGDSIGHLNAYICALTGQPKEVIAAIDSVDKKISMAIAIFFL